MVISSDSFIDRITTLTYRLGLIFFICLNSNKPETFKPVRGIEIGGVPL